MITLICLNKPSVCQGRPHRRGEKRSERDGICGMGNGIGAADLRDAGLSQRSGGGIEQGVDDECLNQCRPSRLAQ